MLQQKLDGALPHEGANGPKDFPTYREVLADQRHDGEEIERRFRQLDALYRMTAAVSRASKLDIIYNEALNCLQDALHADRAAVLLFDNDGVMRFKAQRGLSAGYCVAVEGHSPWAQDATEAHAFGIGDVAAEMDHGALRDTVLREGIGALAFVPLMSSRQLLGKFMVYYNEPHAFTADELQLAQTIASQISIAISRARADAAVLERERSFRGLAEHLPMVIARFNREVRYLYVNPAIELATGITAEELIGTPLEHNRATPEVSNLWRRRIERCFATRLPVDFEFSYPTPNGIRSFHTQIVPEYDEHGQVNSVISISSDITERVHAEERQRFLAELSTRLVESLDYETTLMNFAHLLIETLADGCAIDEVTTDGGLRRICAVAKTVSVKFDPPLPNVDAIRRVATPRLMQLPLRARGRTLALLTLIVNDAGRLYDEADLIFAEELAHRAALVIDNARLYQEAQKASAAKSAFFATMSHELRTPLNAILGYTELLELGIAGPINEPQAKQLERISASAWHLLSVIEEILTFSRVEAGREEVHFESVEVWQLMQEAAQMIVPVAERKAIEFNLLLPSRSASFRTDRVKVRQVLLNLLSNAVKFTDAGRINFIGEITDESVVFRVTDTGPGIPAESRDRVFEPFWQATQGSTRKAGGTGLGLTVSRQLTEMLNGNLALDSTVGIGSTFTVTLPTPIN